MTIMSALSISLSGLQAAGQRFEASARRIVAAGAEAGNALVAASGNGDEGPVTGTGAATGSGRIGFAPDMAGAMVDMLQAETAFKANARVAGRIQDMQQAYLDMLAEKPTR